MKTWVKRKQGLSDLGLEVFRIESNEEVEINFSLAILTFTLTGLTRASLRQIVSFLRFAGEELDKVVQEENP